jgi:hypothetical protein
VVAIIGTPTPTTAYAVFHDAWTFGAVCLFVAGLGCLLIGPVKAGEVPAPGDATRGDAARAVRAETEPGGALRSPRQRRVIAPGTGDPAAARAEPAAEFLTRTPLFSDLDAELRKQLAAKSHTRHLAGERDKVGEATPRVPRQPDPRIPTGPAATMTRRHAPVGVPLPNPEP